MASQPSSFIVTLPKAELHLHLEGAIDPTTLLDLRQRHGKTSTLAEIEQLYSYQDFNGFLMAFKSVTEDLQTADDYELITYRLMERLKAQNVLHAEVYVSVGVCLRRKQDFDALFEGLERGRQKGSPRFWCFVVMDFRCGAPVRAGRRSRGLPGRGSPSGTKRRGHRSRRRRGERTARVVSRGLRICRR